MGRNFRWVYPPVLNYDGLDDYRSYGWQRQLHLYEVPFYYIEYGIAQLGAIGMWQQFKNKDAALNNYIQSIIVWAATTTLPNLFKAAGLEFNFSPEYISKLMQFEKVKWKLIAEIAGYFALSFW